MTESNQPPPGPSLPDGVPQPPDGFDYWGDKSLHVFAEDWQIEDVAGLAFNCNPPWETGYHGALSNHHYAIRRGTELHRLNFGTPLAQPEVEEPIDGSASHDAIMSAALGHLAPAGTWFRDEVLTPIWHASTKEEAIAAAKGARSRIEALGLWIGDREQQPPARADGPAPDPLAVMAALEACGYECEAGPLRMNIHWQVLRNQCAELSAARAEAVRRLELLRKADRALDNLWGGYRTMEAPLAIEIHNELQAAALPQPTTESR